MCKKILPLLSCLFLTTYVNASSFFIVNNTAKTWTIMLNSICSAQDGKNGIIKPYSQFNIPDLLLSSACKNLGCSADFYLSNKCQGTLVANAEISMKKGVLAVSNYEPSYRVTFNSYTITIEQ
ncbi:hypothetical protein ACNVED_08335 [Legionella sp. D16C41]|uniref:hypothetical protein n=1 Tax=Legionella sp. D16C41 TaxID=3402688 RepID=UPI003AF83873